MNQKEIESYLKTSSFGRRMYCFDAIDSTNIFAKTLISQEVPEGTLIIADEQTLGKGRLGRSWQSEKGMNLTFSLILQPKIPADQLGIISLYAGVAVAKALQGFIDHRVLCKWPNDVLINGKKICGILSESVIEAGGRNNVIVGIGINVNQSSFPVDLQPTASSLFLLDKKSRDRFEVLAKVLEHLEQLYLSIEHGEVRHILSLWENLSAIIGKQVVVQQQSKSLTGIAKGISNDGALLLQTEDNEIKIYAGDVTLTHQPTPV